MDEEPEDWYYTREGERCGPVSFVELRNLVAERMINPRMDQVWRQGMDEWKPAGEIEGLFQRSAPPGPQPTPAGTVASVPPEPEPTPIDLRSSDHLSGRRPSSGRRIRMLVFLPVAIVLASVGWAAFWLTYDFLWSLLPDVTVRIPWVVLVFVFCGCGYAIGLPLGMWIRTFDLQTRLANNLVCLSLVTSAAVVGEFVYAGCLLKLADLPAGLTEITYVVTQQFMADDFMGILAGAAQFLLRSLIAIGAFVGATSVMSSGKSGEAQEAEPATP